MKTKPEKFKDPMELRAHEKRLSVYLSGLAKGRYLPFGDITEICTDFGYQFERVPADTWWGKTDKEIWAYEWQLQVSRGVPAEY